MRIRYITADCYEWMQDQETDSVDLVICSPPYEDARFYDIDFRLRDKAWVDWAHDRFLECARISRGLVVWVIEGRTRKFQWSATPALLMAELHESGVYLRKPPIYHRQGIPGSGGPDFWRNDYEFCVCGSKVRRLPFSDNTANGHPPVCKGGATTHRTASGKRVKNTRFNDPDLCNAGNVISGLVGGAGMGAFAAHEGEAPFPEWLVRPFIQCYCPPGGTVLDIFSGTGTTMSVAKHLGRNGIGIDIRKSQNKIGKRRTARPINFLEQIAIDTANKASMRRARLALTIEE